MSTDPRPADASPASAPRPDGLPEGRSPARPVPRAGSSLLARLLTAIFALVVTPLAAGLIAWGGSGWLRYFMTSGYVEISLRDLFAGPLGIRIILGLGLGLLLLASVVATGLASSAGLLAAGALGLVSLTISAAPAVLLSMYRLLTPIIPIEVLDGFVYGVPAVLHPLLGGLGLALVIARRRPGSAMIASLIGLVAVPIGLLLGLMLLIAGTSRSLTRAVSMFETEIQPLGVVLILAGALLLCVAAAASRWSPIALLVPAIVLLAGTALMALPGPLSVTNQLWSHPLGQAAATFLLVGGGLAVAVILVVHTVVQILVHSRARKRSVALAS